MEGTLFIQGFRFGNEWCNVVVGKISLCGGGRTFGQDRTKMQSKESKGVRASTTSNERLHSTTPLIEREERELGHSCRHY